MKAAKFEYTHAGTIADALSALAGSDGGCKIMAGSQSLGPMLNLRLARPAAVVDISGVPELCTVTQAGDTLRVGAAVTHAQIEDGVFEPLRGHMLQEVAGRIAYRAVRNRGTLGGSLAHADPAADWVLAATALAAEIEIVSATGTRRVAMPAFMHGAYTTEVGPTEMIAAVYIPKKSAGVRWGYYKFCRKTGEFAEASCSAYFDPAAKIARIAVGALDGAPRYLSELAGRVAQEGLKAADAASIAVAVEAITPGKSAVDRSLYATVVERCLRQALGEQRNAYV